MPSFTTVVEDSSPLINYSSGWTPGSPSDDGTVFYSQSSFMNTDKQGEQLTLKYQGTSVTVVGAKRGNHGIYHAQIDSTAYPSVSGQNNLNQDTFNYTLFTKQIEYGDHILTLINDENKYLDIDYIAFDTTIGEPEEPIIIKSYQDLHPTFTYSPPNSWVAADQASWFSGSSGHQSSDPAARAQFTFSGAAVALYGSVGPNGSTAFSVQVDNLSASVLSARRSQFRPQQLLFWAGNLTSGNHTLYIQPQTTLGAISIDYANVYTTHSLGGSFDNVDVVTQIKEGNLGISTSDSSNIPTSIIVALGITSAIAIISIFCLITLLRKYRHIIHFRRKPLTKVRPFLPHLRTQPGQSTTNDSPATSIYPTTHNSAFGQPYFLQYMDPQSSIGTPVHFDLARAGHPFSPPDLLPHQRASSYELDPSRNNHFPQDSKILGLSRSLTSLRDGVAVTSSVPPVPHRGNGAVPPPQYTPVSGRPYLEAS
ncbi:hypothetical protein CPB83DRAFT_816864 [Crepidotus variabilis]|uniref:Transmembrane protein n=1 Tax=Crepidotus variabilis TaxID=179855 RepID=A0A9P6EBS4_9AGAR|nr:hypothetical protein CPB83DRAFT_816864 [Crepidotus variabilis]